MLPGCGDDGAAVAIAVDERRCGIDGRADIDRDVARESIGHPAKRPPASRWTIASAPNTGTPPTVCATRMWARPSASISTLRARPSSTPAVSARRLPQVAETEILGALQRGLDHRPRTVQPRADRSTVWRPRLTSPLRWRDELREARH